MKHSILIVFFFLTTVVLAQKNVKRELQPARGHYKQLSVLSTKPKSTSEEIDKLHFPEEPAVKERRLSLKPHYLTNTTLSDFNIPDPPANSSEQTRAELNYLLSLQNQRTKLEVESSLVM